MFLFQPTLENGASEEEERQEAERRLEAKQQGDWMTDGYKPFPYFFEEVEDQTEN